MPLGGLLALMCLPVLCSLHGIIPTTLEAARAGEAPSLVSPTPSAEPGTWQVLHQCLLDRPEVGALFCIFHWETVNKSSLGLVFLVSRLESTSALVTGLL